MDSEPTRMDDALGWVEARFEKGTVSPLRFRWRRREFEVTAVHARWVDRATRPIRWFCSVSVSSGEILQLCYREGDPVWRLTQVET